MARDRLEKVCFVRWIHNVTSYLVACAKQTSPIPKFEEFCLTPNLRAWQGFCLRITHDLIRWRSISTIKIVAELL